MPHAGLIRVVLTARRPTSHISSPALSPDLGRDERKSKHRRGWSNSSELSRPAATARLPRAEIFFEKRDFEPPKRLSKQLRPTLDPCSHPTRPGPAPRWRSLPLARRPNTSRAGDHTSSRSRLNTCRVPVETSRSLFVPSQPLSGLPAALRKTRFYKKILRDHQTSSKPRRGPFPYDPDHDTLSRQRPQGMTDETARIHHASRRRSGGAAARKFSARGSRAVCGGPRGREEFAHPPTAPNRLGLRARPES
jgi:hypothetical protein